MFEMVNSHFIFENGRDALEVDSAINEIRINSVKIKI